MPMGNYEDYKITIGRQPDETGRKKDAADEMTTS
jgi:hypothetical protein